MSEIEEGTYRAIRDHLCLMQMSGSLEECIKGAIREALDKDENWRDNLAQSASELRMVRETLETCGPVGILNAEEQNLQPGQEGATLAEAIRKLCALKSHPAPHPKED